MLSSNIVSEPSEFVSLKTKWDLSGKYWRVLNLINKSAAHTEGSTWFVMCNMCNDDWNIDHRRWSKRCLLTRGNQTLKKNNNNNFQSGSIREIPNIFWPQTSWKSQSRIGTGKRMFQNARDGKFTGFFGKNPLPGKWHLGTQTSKRERERKYNWRKK